MKIKLKDFPSFEIVDLLYGRVIEITIETDLIDDEADTELRKLVLEQLAEEEQPVQE
jgi:hypothetical protein